MNPKLLSSLFALSLLVIGVDPAQAVTIGYELTISESGDPTVPANVPDFSLTNTSDTAGVLLTGFSFTIGDTANNFDIVRRDHTVNGIDPDPPAGGTLTLVGADNSNDGVRVDSYSMVFTSFDPLDLVNWNVDIDMDSSNTTGERFQTTFFNNGGALNSVLTVTFTFDGMEKMFTKILPDGADVTSYTFSDSMTLNQIPEPGTLALFLVGLAGLGVMSRRRRKQLATA